MIILSSSSADRQANDLFKMCMVARGYRWREVNDEEYEAIINNPLRSKIEPLVKERMNICDKEEYKIVMKKSACLPKDITIEQLFDKSMITDVEKDVYLKYRAETRPIINRIQDATKTYGTPKDKEISLFVEKNNIKTDTLAIDLVERRISWGEFNKKRKEFDEERIKEQERIFSKK